jgi:hypothetical protein
MLKNGLKILEKQINKINIKINDYEHKNNIRLKNDKEW